MSFEAKTCVVVICDGGWRVGRRCAACNYYGPEPHGGQCTVGTAWRPATLWQRIRYRGRP